MAAVDVLFWIALLFLVPQALVLTVNLATFPRLRRPSSPYRAKVSILVPARDEAHNLPETLPLLLAQGAHEVIVCDDDSTDGTGEILARLAREHPRLRTFRGRPVPAGWTGKNWACHQLSERATGDLWAFTDADVRWSPGAMEALLSLHRDGSAGLTTVWPRQIAVTWFERLVVPVVDLLLLAGLPHPAALHVPVAALAAGNGQLMMFTPEAYARSGGHAGVRGKVLEDVRLAQRAKAVGVRLALGLGGGMLATRMYRDRREVIEGFAKNVLAAVGGSALLLWSIASLNTLAFSLVWLLALVEPRWLVLGVMGVAMRAATAWKTGRPVLEAPLQAAFPLGLWPIVVRATRRSGSYRWKGRTYP